MENIEYLTVSVPLCDYKELCELRGQVDALERMYSNNTYLTLDDIADVMGFERKAKEPHRVTDDEI